MSSQRTWPTIRGLLLSMSGVVVLLTVTLVLITRPTVTNLAWGLAGVAIALVGSVSLNVGVMSIQRLVDQRMQRRREEKIRPATERETVRERLRELQAEQEVLAQVRALGQDLRELLRRMPLEPLLQVAQERARQEQEGLARQEQNQSKRPTWVTEPAELAKLRELAPRLDRFEVKEPDQEQLANLAELELKLLQLMDWLEPQLRARPEQAEREQRELQEAFPEVQQALRERRAPLRLLQEVLQRKRLRLEEK